MEDQQDAGPTWRVIGPIAVMAVLALGGFVSTFILASNSRQIDGHERRIFALEESRRESAVSLRGIESDVSNLKTTVGEVRVSVGHVTEKLDDLHEALRGAGSLQPQQPHAGCHGPGCGE